MTWRAIRQPKTRWAIVAPTFGDGRDICLEGESGIVSVAERYGMLRDYNRSTGEVFFTNKSRMKTYSGKDYERLRGPQHHGAWVDELGSFTYPQEAFDQLQFGLRLGTHPQVIVTTTPRPSKLIKDLITRKDWVTVRGSTFDNAKNLPESMLSNLLAKYGDTRLGRQELYAEILEDVEGALWTHQVIEDGRIAKDKMPQLLRIVVGVDPAASNNPNSDSTGIVVVGVSSDRQFYVLSDKTLKASPQGWAEAAVAAYKEFSADRVVAERNNGGDMVESTLRHVDYNVPVKLVWASKGKKLRAEPISALYEQGRVHHVGYFGELEEQMCEWTQESDDSPDRLDALVWALTELSEGSNSMMGLSAMANICSKCGMPNIKSASACFKCGEKFEVAQQDSGLNAL